MAICNKINQLFVLEGNAQPTSTNREGVTGQTIFFAPDQNRIFIMDSTGNISTIGGADITVIPVPSEEDSLVYTGSEQSPTWIDYDPATSVIGGDVKGKNAGTYTTTFTPRPGYSWTGGSTEAEEVEWEIDKAANSVTISKNSVSLTTASPSDTVTVTKTAGDVSAVSSDEGVATVSVEGTTVTITSVANGTATVTISVSASENYEAGEDKEVAVSVSLE